MLSKLFPFPILESFQPFLYTHRHIFFILYIYSFDNECAHYAGPDDMPAHIKSSLFGCALTWVILHSFLNKCVPNMLFSSVVILL